MSKAAYDKIAEGLNEALAIARGEAEPYDLHVPPEIDVRAIRGKAGMTQECSPRAQGWTGMDRFNAGARARPGCCGNARRWVKGAERMTLQERIIGDDR